MKIIKLFKISFLSIFLILSSCEENQINSPKSNLDFTVEPINNPIIIDEPTELVISSNFEFNQIDIQKTMYSTYHPNIWELTKVDTICFVFTKNTQIFDIKLINQDTKERLQKQFEFSSNRGSGIKIKNIEITSFTNEKLGYEIGDFNNNEEFKFIQFELFKHVDECVGSSKELYQWFLSKALDRNAENYVWNLESEDVIINDKDYLIEIRPFYINNDEGKIRAVDDLLILPDQLDLLNVDYFYEDPISFNLKDYSLEKPEFMTIRNENLNFEMKIQIEW